MSTDRDPLREALQELATHLRANDWNLRAPQEMADMIASHLDNIAALSQPQAPEDERRDALAGVRAPEVASLPAWWSCTRSCSCTRGQCDEKAALLRLVERHNATASSCPLPSLGEPSKEEVLHSCSYYCDRPACIKAQRDEMRDRLEGTEAAADKTGESK